MLKLTFEHDSYCIRIEVKVRFGKMVTKEAGSILAWEVQDALLFLDICALLLDSLSYKIARVS